MREFFLAVFLLMALACGYIAFGLCLYERGVARDLKQRCRAAYIARHDTTGCPPRERLDGNR